MIKTTFGECNEKDNFNSAVNCHIASDVMRFCKRPFS